MLGSSAEAEKLPADRVASPAAGGREPSAQEADADPAPSSHRAAVTFLPDGMRTEVPLGVSLLEAAHEAGVYVNSICGGRQSCGKCRLIVVQGDVEGEDAGLLSEKERRRGYVLACASRVAGDVTVMVPEETRLGEAQILVGEADRGLTGEQLDRARQLLFPFEPLVVKQYLELDPPTVENNLADHERLYHGIHRALGTEMPMQTGYRILKVLPHVLRQSEFKVTATIGHRAGVLEGTVVERGNSSRRNFGVAIDVGTTTVVVHLMDLTSGEALASAATYNSQMRFGEDYIQRIIYAEEHDAFTEMQELVVADINGLIEQVARSGGIRVSDILAAMCAGNTAMLHLLLGLDPTRIRREPYIPTANFVPPLRAREVGIHINERGLLFSMPSVAAYIGGDITAGVLATRLYEREELSLFIDIGTNGEVVLGNRDWLVAASCSAGPAFEGSGVEHGMRAASGAIQQLAVGAGLDVRYHTIGGQRPRGLCGSGLLDAIAELFLAGAIDRRGKIDPSQNGRRVRDIVGGREFLLVPGAETATGEDITISDHDIANLLRSKAAVYAAISVLLESMDLTPEAVQRVCLAGGFGNYLDPRKAVLIGMLPDVTRDRVQFVGNTSLAGAKTALLSRTAYAKAEEIARQMTYFDLMGNLKFMDEFSQANFLPHTHIEEFPSVVAQLEAARDQGTRPAAGRSPDPQEGEGP
jgi:uncharacterized 2Fe-2S/4Fe-4S cluster protein (DUF4445 family)